MAAKPKKPRKKNELGIARHKGYSGRVTKGIDAEAVRRMAQEGLDAQQIGRCLRLSKPEMELIADIVSNGQAEGVAAMKRALYRKGVEEGNPACLIFGLKNRAGWSDNNGASAQGVVITVNEADVD